MRILITGGTGFIGSRLALRCLERGDQVVVLGQESTDAERQNRKLIEDKGARVALGSVTNKDLLINITKGIDIVFHLAAAQHEANIPDKVFHDVNVTGTRNMLEASIAAGVKRFVHGSTIGVYGSPNGAVDEFSPCSPDNIYGQTKLEGENLALSFNEKIPVVVVRISEVYGPGDRRLLKLFNMIQKNKFFMIGDGKNLHHLIYIDDLIEAFLLAANVENGAGQVLLLAGEKPIPTNDMVAVIAEQLSAKGALFRVPFFPLWLLAAIMEFTFRPFGIQPPLHRRRMDFFKKSFNLSWKKAAEKLNYQPAVSFEEGVARTAKWYESQGLLQTTISGGRSEAVKNRYYGASEAKKPEPLESEFELTARIEPFDSFWEAPEDIERGFASFGQFYKHNYLKHFPIEKQSKILVISCGPGYMVNLLNQNGYANVLGIDSILEKILPARLRKLNCKAARAFDFLDENIEPYDVIFCEQELNHLSKTEILSFLGLCHKNLRDGGTLIIHSLNGANPIVGPENLALNFDHYNTFTEKSLVQILEYCNFINIEIFPLKLYVFYKNPINYIGLSLDHVVNLIFKLTFAFYGKSNRIFTKKVAAVCQKSYRNYQE